MVFCIESNWGFCIVEIYLEIYNSRVLVRTDRVVGSWKSGSRGFRFYCVVY